MVLGIINLIFVIRVQPLGLVVSQLLTASGNVHACPCNLLVVLDNYSHFCSVELEAA